LIDNWSRIDWGRPLRIWQGPDGRSGHQLATPVGRLDFLCQDSATDALVVVELKRGIPSNRVVGRTARYMGWVSVNLSEGRSVDGIVVAHDADRRWSSSRGAERCALHTARVDCVFCAIIAGEAPASPVYDDESVLAFMDIAPATRGHLLVVPKAHASYLVDLDPQDGARMFVVAQRLAQALRDSSLLAEGINLFLADGEVAFQEVFHVHLHVLPRTRGDGFALQADFGNPDRDVLNAQAADIRHVLDTVLRQSS
jgi:histidine triad (HIT) family protein